LELQPVLQGLITIGRLESDQNIEMVNKNTRLSTTVHCHDDEERRRKRNNKKKKKKKEEKKTLLSLLLFDSCCLASGCLAFGFSSGSL